MAGARARSLVRVKAKISHTGQGCLQRYWYMSASTFVKGPPSRRPAGCVVFSSEIIMYVYTPCVCTRENRKKISPGREKLPPLRATAAPTPVAATTHHADGVAHHCRLLSLRHAALSVPSSPLSAYFKGWLATSLGHTAQPKDSGACRRRKTNYTPSTNVRSL